MALLGTSPGPNLDFAPPPPSPLPAAVASAAAANSGSSEFSVASGGGILMPPVGGAAAGPLSGKLPKGRHLVGDHVVYDVDVRLQGEVQPQLEVTPITKYVSDPGLVLGRQIAVNRTYICYGLKLGPIRVLNINTALRALLRGHTQKVSDMSFFAEEVHLLASASIDGRIYVWRIIEGTDDEDKPQIAGKVITAVQMAGDAEPEVLVVGIGKRVLRIDTTKVGKGEQFSAEEPLKCNVEKLIDGIQLIGKHDGEVTDLSICQWMTTRLVSASSDGTIKIWEDRKGLPLLVLRPHDGQPVSSAIFLTAPTRPDHVILITAGPLNREVKIWASASEEGWLLPSDAESWQCMQTLELKSSAETRAEEAFFNQVVALPQVGLILLANAKKNAIYAVHLDYGSCPVATIMDYIAEFTVTMPILSLIGTSDCLPDGDIVQVYCVQTQAIQQYALDLSQCLPPPIENVGSDKLDFTVNRTMEAPSLDGFATSEPPQGSGSNEMHYAVFAKQQSPISSFENAPSSRYPVTPGTAEVPGLPDLSTSSIEAMQNASSRTASDVENVSAASPPLPLSPRLSRKLSGFRSPSNSLETSSPHSDRAVDQLVLDYSIERRVETVPPNSLDVPTIDGNSRKGGNRATQNDISMVANAPTVFKHPTHLVTPSEILSKAVSSSETNQISQGMGGGETKVQDVATNDMDNIEVEVKVVGETGSSKHEDFDSKKESGIFIDKKEKLFYSQASDLNFHIEMAKECCDLASENHAMDDTQQADDTGVTEVFDQCQNTGEEEFQDSLKDMSGKVAESSTVTAVAQTPGPTGKGKKQKGKSSQVSGSSSPTPSPFNSNDSSNEPGGSSILPSLETAFSQLTSMQETMNQAIDDNAKRYAETNASFDDCSSD
ncbi:hypothetical protein Syun_010654 [Stephania yunnanensis]|uniref:Enhancer of mRNA-decapping protein 4 WD40 repeat region domain-containing protein n=1 Tax=Stephania yunnanensis TaxID=152371 RepID=A0AAP0KHU3_9MAGN